MPVLSGGGGILEKSKTAQMWTCLLSVMSGRTCESCREWQSARVMPYMQVMLLSNRQVYCAGLLMYSLFKSFPKLDKDESFKMLPLILLSPP